MVLPFSDLSRTENLIRSDPVTLLCMPLLLIKSQELNALNLHAQTQTHSHMCIHVHEHTATCTQTLLLKHNFMHFVLYPNYVLCQF